MRSFAQFSVVGVAALVMLKLLAVILFPLLGVLIGLFAMTVKFAFIAAVVLFFYTMFKRRRACRDA